MAKVIYRNTEKPKLVRGLAIAGVVIVLILGILLAVGVIDGLSFFYWCWSVIFVFVMTSDYLLREVTLLAGAITSISLYVTNQDLITTLLVLFIVLFVFYFLGVLAMKIIVDSFNKKNDKDNTPVSDEGQVLEKDIK